MSIAKASQNSQQVRNVLAAKLSDEWFHTCSFNRLSFARGAGVGFTRGAGDGLSSQVELGRLTHVELTLASHVEW